MRFPRGRAKRFTDDERGSATVETVLWFPFYIAMFTLVVDASMIFHNQTFVTRVIQDGNRAFSVGRLSGTEETQRFIRDRISGLSAGADVVTRLDSGIISTTVSVPVGDLDAIGWFAGLTGFDLVMSAEHYREM
jgi:hypothetical protein